MATHDWRILTEEFFLANIFVEIPRGKYQSVFKQRSRSRNLLYYCRQGTREYCTPEGKHFLSSRPGDIMLMPAASTYDTVVSSEKEASGYGIMFNLYDLNQKEIILGSRPEILLRDKNDFYLEKFREIYGLRLSAGFATMPIKYRLYELLYLLVTQNMREEAEQHSGSVLPAVHYMESHLRENCTVDQLAQLCFMSRSTFHRRFQEEYHASPIAWHLNRRIQKSRELLASGMYTVERVAETMGFCDTCYFSRMFYKYTGHHARDYRSCRR